MINPTLIKDKGVIQDEPTLATLPLKRTFEPKDPFLECLKKLNQFAKQGEKIPNMLEVFKQVKINYPLLSLMP
jgi:hypothetical protein